MMGIKKYWEFKNQTDDTADLYLYVEIASWGGGYYAHSAKSFKQELDNMGDINTLNVYINSPGGDVFEGVAIYNMLKRHKAHVNVHVDGLAASIASVIAMAADTIHMPSNAMMMIHNAWLYTAGNSNDLREAADMLDKVNTSIRQSYMQKAGDGISEEDLTKLMDDETWLTAQECLDYGLCDVVESATEIAASVNKDMFNRYKNTPEDLLNHTNKSNAADNVKEQEYRKQLIAESKASNEKLKLYLGGI
ncbi:Clp protease ClpP [Bacillus cereus group sp. Sample62]